MTAIVKGHPSTNDDSYQLNTTTLIRHSARNYPEREIVYRTGDGDGTATPTPTPTRASSGLPTP